MKVFKNISIIFIFFLLVAIGSDDDGETTDDVFTPAIIHDTSTVIKRPTAVDISDFIDFKQGEEIPAKKYPLKLDINDRLQLRQPSVLLSDFTLWYSWIYFFKENSVPGTFNINSGSGDAFT